MVVKQNCNIRSDNRVIFAILIRCVILVGFFLFLSTAHAVPPAPALNAATSPTNDNPYTISGTADPLAEIIVYLNGASYIILNADSGGNFSAKLALLDGVNSVHATVWDDVEGESPASNSLSIDYVNNLSRSQSGTITQDTVWTKGTTGAYKINGDLTVASGKTLTIQRGVTVEFSGYYELFVYGSLQVLGTAADPVLVTSGLTNPTKNSWDDLEIKSSAFDVIIDHAIFEYADKAFLILGNSDVSVTDSEFRHNRRGISPENGSSPVTIEDNYVHDNDIGIYVDHGSNPTLTGNTITQNATGIQLNRSNGSSGINPNPVITGNAIHGNTSYDLYAGNDFLDPDNVVIDATGNWWGTTDPVLIESRIRHRNDDTNISSNGGVPWVDFGGYLSVDGGQPVHNHQILIGPVTTTTTLTGGETYEVLSDIFVPQGVTLTIPAGAILKFSGYFEVIVEGTLKLLGSSSQPVLLTSNFATPSADDWDDLEIRSTASGVVIDHAIIEYADRAILLLNNSDVEITNSEIRYNDFGMSIDNGSSPSIVQGNHVHDNDTGIYVDNGSAPSIQNNDVLNNGYGFFIARSNGATGINPAPVVTGNSIFGNTIYNYYSENDFTDAANVTLNATGNWWGTSDWKLILASVKDRFSSGSNRPWVDYGFFVDGPGGTTVFAVWGTEITVPDITPRLGETAVMQFRTNFAVDSTISIYAHDGSTVLYQSTASHAAGGPHTLVWDGKDTQAQFVSDGVYRMAVNFTDGTNNDSWDPVVSGTGSGFGILPNSYNGYINDFFKFDYNLQTTSLVSMRVTPSGETAFWPINGEPYGKGVHQIVWDGRDADGDLVSGSVGIFMDVPQNLRANAIVVRGDKPTIVGLYSTPNIEVKSDPYFVTHSHDQFTRIGFQTDQDAMISLKLLPPGVSDPASPAAVLIVDNELKAASDINGDPVDHVVEWLGYSAADTNNILVSEDGAYTFTIEATSVATGQTSVYRGVLQIRQ